MGTWEECVACHGVGTITVICPVCEGKKEWKQKRHGFLITIQCPHCRDGGAKPQGRFTHACIACNGRQGIFIVNEQDRKNKAEILKTWREAARLASFQEDARSFWFGESLFHPRTEVMDYYRAIQQDSQNKRRAMYEAAATLGERLRRSGWTGKYCLGSWARMASCDKFLVKSEKYLLDAENVLADIEAVRRAAAAYRDWLVEELELGEGIDEEGYIIGFNG